MNPREIAALVCKTLDDKRAQDIRVLEVGDLTVLADFFVLATATSGTHMKTLAGECEMKLKEKGIVPHHVEGHRSGNWILLDLGAVVIHVFLQETRAFYSVERLWADAKTWDLEELIGKGDAV
ncbi:MAG: ribosome silencing factor [Oscillospiraceae bacterium]|jgi:ribosome-associated protein|nr:ribosome silencing factor [Oscillospiraceae bacterium]